MHPYEVFISYSHEDSSFLPKLRNHLQSLKEQNLINTWSDTDISPGTEWEPQIMGRLNSAQIILLLISADFMGSKFCYSIEMKTAIQRHKDKQARVLPIVLRSVDWEGAPFAELQMLPTGAKPIKQWSDMDEAFKDVARGIRKAIKDLDEEKAKPANP